MNEDRIVAAIITAGILAGSQKSVPAGRAAMILNDVIAALAPPSPAPVIEQPSISRRDEAPRVNWLPGASLNGNRE